MNSIFSKEYEPVTKSEKNSKKKMIAARHSEKKRDFLKKKGEKVFTWPPCSTDHAPCRMPKLQLMWPNAATPGPPVDSQAGDATVYSKHTIHYTTLHYRHYISTLHETTRHTTLHDTTRHDTTRNTLHYTKLNYTTRHYTTLHDTTIHDTTLHYTTLHYTTLHYTTLHYTTLHCTTLH